MPTKFLSLVACVFVFSGLARAETPDPLRLVPAATDAIVKVENPRQLFDTIYNHEIVQELLKLDSITAFYDTTKFRRLMQFIAYFEKELGHERLDLLERLTGGGVVAAVDFTKPSVLVVVEAKDEGLLKSFVTLAYKTGTQELARLDATEKLEERSYRGLDTFHLGNVAHVCRAGSALVFSNDEVVLDKALDRFLDGGKDSLAAAPRLAEFKARLPKNSLVWGALNLDEAKKNQNIKNTLNTLGLDPVTMFSVGGVVDVIKRSPYVCVGLAQEGKNLRLRIAMPRGREGMAPLASMFLPADARGSLPMLQPPRVLSCTSYYLDLGTFWTNRHKILTKEQAKTIDNFEAQTGKYLKAIGLGKLLEQAGKYQRVVFAIPDKSPYKIKPTVETGSFAVVLDMRDPAFAKSMSTVLRGAALIGSFKFGLKMVDERYKDHTLVTYYFPENRPLPEDETNIRFNFSPCFTQVGNQFVISSTLELGKDLVDCLLKDNGEASPATQRTTVYGTGVAANLRTANDLLVSKMILSQALPASEAKKQFEQLVHLVERLGQLRLETFYGQNDFRFDINWRYEK